MLHHRLRQRLALRPTRVPVQLLVAWAVTLLGTTAYLALVSAFDVKVVMLGLMVVAAVLISAFWIADEPAELIDEVDVCGPSKSPRRVAHRS